MREDEHIRQFMPVLRRIIIMVAVLTAIPVAMWTITAFVRTYVGPPKAPNYQPTILPSGVTSDEANAAPVDSASAATQDPDAPPPPDVVIARATTTDADSNPPPANPASATPIAAGSSVIPSRATPAPPAPSAATTPAVSAAAPAPPPWPAPGPAAPPATSQTPDNAFTLAAQQPAPTNWPAPPPAADDALPAVEPIAGIVPLPRKRPHSFVVAQSIIPLPRPRPEAAGPGAPPPAPATPLDWIQHIFQQPSGSAATPAATPAVDDTNDAVATPH